MIRQRVFLNRNRRRIALLAVLGVLTLAVVFEHSGLGHGEMSDGMAKAISMCLAVLQVGALLVGSVATLRARRPRPPREPPMGPVAPLAASSVEIPPPRAGPPVLQVFRS